MLLHLRCEYLEARAKPDRMQRVVRRHCSYDLLASFLPLSIYISSKYPRVLRTGVASRSQNSNSAEANPTKLFEKGAALLSSSDSRKPICLACLDLWGKGFFQYELSGVDCTILPYHSCKLEENCVPL